MAPKEGTNKKGAADTLPPHRASATADTSSVSQSQLRYKHAGFQHGFNEQYRSESISNARYDYPQELPNPILSPQYQPSHGCPAAYTYGPSPAQTSHYVPPPRALVDQGFYTPGQTHDQHLYSGGTPMTRSPPSAVLGQYGVDTDDPIERFLDDTEDPYFNATIATDEYGRPVYRSTGGTGYAVVPSQGSKNSRYQESPTLLSATGRSNGHGQGSHYGSSQGGRAGGCPSRKGR